MHTKIFHFAPPHRELSALLPCSSTPLLLSLRSEVGTRHSINNKPPKNSSNILGFLNYIPQGWFSSLVAELHGVLSRTRRKLTSDVLLQSILLFPKPKIYCISLETKIWSFANDIHYLTFLPSFSTSCLDNRTTIRTVWVWLIKRLDVMLN